MKTRDAPVLPPSQHSGNRSTPLGGLEYVHILQQLFHLGEVFHLDLVAVTIPILMAPGFGLVVAELEPAAVKGVLVLVASDVCHNCFGLDSSPLVGDSPAMAVRQYQWRREVETLSPSLTLQLRPVVGVSRHRGRHSS